MNQKPLAWTTWENEMETKYGSYKRKPYNEGRVVPGNHKKVDLSALHAHLEKKKEKQKLAGELIDM